MRLWILTCFSLVFIAACTVPHAPPTAGVDRSISPDDLSVNTTDTSTDGSKVEEWTPPDRNLMEDIPPAYRNAVRQYYGDALEKTPLLDWFDHGMEAYREGNYDEAARSLKKILEEFPDFHVVRYNLGLVYYQQERYREAIETFEYVLQRIQRTNQLGEEDINLRFNPDLVHDAQVNLAMAYFNVGQTEKAITILTDMMPDETAHYDLITIYDSLQQYDRVIELTQDYTEKYGEEAELLNLMGLAYYRKGQLEPALQAFEHAVKVDSENLQIYVNLGHLYMRVQQYDRAEEAFRKAKQLDPDVDVDTYLKSLQQQDTQQARAYYNEGVNFWNVRQLDAAISAWRKSVELDPDFAEAHLNLGIAYRERGRYTDALTHLKKAVELKPDLAEAQYQIGLTYSRMRQYQDAIVAFHRAASLQPRRSDIQYNLGIALYRSGQKEKAVEALRQATQLKPNWLEPQMNLGLILGELKQYSEAIKTFEQLLKVHPRNSDAYYNLGVLRFKNKDPQGAIQALERAVHYNPMNTRAQALLEQLKGSKPAAATPSP